MDYGLKQPKLLQFVLIHAIVVMNHNSIQHLSNDSIVSCLQKILCKANGKNTVKMPKYSFVMLVEIS
jgi:hypothetical protein